MMTELDSEDASSTGLQQDGIIVCPFCGYEGEDFDTARNFTGQEIFVCPECEEGI